MDLDRDDKINFDDFLIVAERWLLNGAVSSALKAGQKFQRGAKEAYFLRRGNLLFHYLAITAVLS